ncbi:MAG: PAC2 family protein [Chloroflexi bacterium]|nr:PAC2 family protein [Chloroflexota bacterium]
MRIGEFEIAEPVPEMKNTRVIAMLRPWVDVGRVGTLVLNRLERHLGAQELGRLSKPGVYFDFTRYRPRMRIVDGQRVFTRPNTIVHYAHDDDKDQDYLFLHIREPHAMGEDYTDAIVGLLKHFDVAEYCRIGGMYDSVPHTRPVLVTGSLTSEYEEKAKGLVSIRRSTYQGPTSIVNMVTESLTESEVPSVNLMAHLPQYVQLDEDHMGAARLMSVLCAMYDFPEKLADLSRGEQQYQDINRAVQNNPEVKSLIQQLEAYYDRTLAVREPTEEAPAEDETSFAPDVEQFLREVGQRLETPGDIQDDDYDDDYED